MRASIVVWVAIAGSGCILGDYEVERCDPFAAEDVCQRLTAADSCHGYACDPRSRRCERVVTDGDHDGDPAVACGGSDCDDHDPTRAGTIPGSCVPCASDADCVNALGATSPPDCADATCDATLGACAFAARDADHDGHRLAACTATTDLPIVVGDDCDDGDPDTFAGAAERCDNRDNDCDGKIDDGIPPSSEPCDVGFGVCKRTGQKLCVAGVWSGCTVAAAAPGQTSDAPQCDGTDYNCDGQFGPECPCVSGSKQTCYAGSSNVCNQIEITCTNGQWPACPTAVDKITYCYDGDGDGACGSSCAQYCPPGYPNGPTDGHYKSNCSPTDCNDGAASVHPGAGEVCNGVDDNCSGSVDEGTDMSCSNQCGSGTISCVNGSYSSCTAPTTASCVVCSWWPGNEDCGNGACNAISQPTSLSPTGGFFAHDCGVAHPDGWYVGGDVDTYCDALRGAGTLPPGSYSVTLQLWGAGGPSTTGVWVDIYVGGHKVADNYRFTGTVTLGGYPLTMGPGCNVPDIRVLYRGGGYTNAMTILGVQLTGP